MVERGQRKKPGGGDAGKDLELNDLSGEIPAVQDVLDKLGQVIKKKVEPPKKSEEGGCCGELLRDCCSD